jgi:hypothetical protein
VFIRPWYITVGACVGGLVFRFITSVCTAQANNREPRPRHLMYLFEPARSRGSVARSWHRSYPSNAWTSEILVVVTEAEHGARRRRNVVSLAERLELHLLNALGHLRGQRQQWDALPCEPRVAQLPGSWPVLFSTARGLTASGVAGSVGAGAEKTVA